MTENRKCNMCKWFREKNIKDVETAQDKLFSHRCVILSIGTNPLSFRCGGEDYFEEPSRAFINEKKKSLPLRRVQKLNATDFMPVILRTKRGKEYPITDCKLQDGRVMVKYSNAWLVLAKDDTITQISTGASPVKPDGSAGLSEPRVTQTDPEKQLGLQDGINQKPK